MSLKVNMFLNDKASGKLKGFAGGVANLGKKFVKMGAVAGIAIGGISVKLAGDFSKGLAEISTLMDDVTDDSMKRMGKELKNIHSQTGLALKGLTKARYDIVSAGFNDAADSAMVLNEAAKLAVGGVTTAAAAADLLTTALNAYDKSADEAADVSDILFTTVKLGKTTMGELAQNMGMMLPMAKSVNIALGDVAAALAVVTANGINTAEASTAINAMMKDFIKPTDDAKAAMAQYGIEIKRFNNGQLDLVSTVRQFEGMSPELITQFIPNVRSLKAILTMANNTDKLADAIVTMGERAGASTKAFGKMNKEWNTKIDKLKANVHIGLIELGDFLIEKLTPLVDKANEILGGMGDVGWANVAREFGENWRGILDLVGVIVDAWVGTMRGKFSKMINDMVKDSGWFFRALTGASKKELETMNQDWDEYIAVREAALARSLKALLGFTSATIAKVKAEQTEAGEKTVEVVTTIGDAIITKQGEVEVAVVESNQRIADSYIEAFEPMFDWEELQIDNLIESWAKKNKDVIAGAQKVVSLVGNLYGSLLNLRKAQIKKELQTQIAATLDSTKSEEEKAATIKNLKAQAAIDEEKAAKELKKIRLAAAIGEAALMVINALQTKPFVPLGIAAGVIATAAGAAQIAAISASPYAEGGIAGAGAFSRHGVPASDTVAAWLTPGEIVSSKAASDKYGSMILKMNEMAGGTAGLVGQSSIMPAFADGGEVPIHRRGPRPESDDSERGINDSYNTWNLTVAIEAMDGDSVFRSINNNKEEFAEGLIELIRGGHIKLFNGGGMVRAKNN
jgi:TP901 family phage tail tape measure protein